MQSAGMLNCFSRVRLFCDPVDYRPPGSSAHGIFRASVLEWVAIVFSTMQETLVQFLGLEDPLEKG